MVTVTESRPSIESGHPLRHWLRGNIHQFISHVEVAIESMSGGSDSYLEQMQGIVGNVEAMLRIADRLGNLDPYRDRLESFADELRQSLSEIDRRYAKVREEASMQPEMLSLLARLESPIARLHATLEALNPERVQELLAQLQQSFSRLTDVQAKANAGSSETATRGVILVVDDNEGNRELLARRLMRNGCDVLLAENGRQALRMARRYAIDVMLLDIMMPEMDGYAVLAELKLDTSLRHLPVVMISAVDDVNSVVHCIESGADDYLFKPFNAVLLRARVQALLERKRLHDEDAAKKHALEQAYLEIEEQRAKTEALLLNILPKSIAAELRTHGFVEPVYYEDSTIVFADIAGFTLGTESLSADELVRKLNRYFSAFDNVAEKHGVEKLKTIGDCYMFAGGVPIASRSHPVTCILAAIEMQDVAAEMDDGEAIPFRLRIGVHTGPVIAGVVGLRKFAFDVWGDTVNLASRVEACGDAGRVNISSSTYARVKDFFHCEKRGPVRIKDGREIEMYYINGLSQSLWRDPALSPKEAFFKRYRSYFHQTPSAFPATMT